MTSEFTSGKGNICSSLMLLIRYLVAMNIARNLYWGNPMLMRFSLMLTWPKSSSYHLWCLIPTTWMKGLKSQLVLRVDQRWKFYKHTHVYRGYPAKRALPPCLCMSLCHMVRGIIINSLYIECWQKLPRTVLVNHTAWFIETYKITIYRHNEWTMAVLGELLGYKGPRARCTKN